MEGDDVRAELVRLAGDAGPTGDADETAPPGQSRGLDRLRWALRELRRNPAEVRRIADIAGAVAAVGRDYERGDEARRAGDDPAAEEHLRRAAEHGHPEAAHWLARTLARRAGRLRRAGYHRDADRLLAEADPWARYAHATGASEALDAEVADSAAPVTLRTVRPHPPVGHAAPGASRPERSRYAVGIELRPFALSLVLLDEQGSRLHEARSPVGGLADRDSLVTTLAGRVDAVVAAGLGPAADPERLAVGLQVGGAFHTRTGVTGWLERATGLPTVVDRDANAFAVREQWTGVGQATEDFAVMLAREGVGASLVHGGRLLRSVHGAFGELLPGIEAAVVAAERARAHPAADGDVATFRASGRAVALGVGRLVEAARPTHVVLYGSKTLLRTAGAASRAFRQQVDRFADHVALGGLGPCQLVCRELGPFDGAEAAALLALERCLGRSPRDRLLDPRTAR